ncbi:glycosyltransferase family 4 protein [Calidifontibacter sp. DB0510]|uniref:D-inositol 3-phosphate glycosyltransferase n=1 Tax=Metallococcus carri TaxID=1656884 RepID=A0A967B7F5_9MICO|nr:glycosyltransferase family 4 protein [Metallococcus carri]NHN56967.1 glycosyltransferase family 4 protein [Metallococcus carri]NOP37712.1 glycosyltransferase family 4 protein [Calidifontibacter sp. DB2511S]
MRVGIVSPYSFDVPGGVQLHVRDLAEWLLGHGHEVNVLAPADEDTPLPGYVTGAGRAVPVPYNGSVARLLFGPLTGARVARWVEHGRFDLVHVHEPVSPSLSMLAMWAVEGPLVATFHTSGTRSRALLASRPALQPGLEKISGRIAVSDEARRFVREHIGGDAVVIPNGVYADRFAAAAPRPEWQGNPEAPTLGFLGRIEEPRKGLPVLLDAIPALLQRFPRLRVLVAGPGDPQVALAGRSPAVREACVFLGRVSDEDKARLLRSVDAYVAPNTGGESFGIILVEAMSACAPVVASDLHAFRAVLDDGWAGALFVNEDSRDLAAVLTDLLLAPADRADLARRGAERARRFDWDKVAGEIVNVYETVLEASPLRAGVPVDARPTRWWRGGN